MYDPTIQSIQVLRLEKRLDDKLLYLRDAFPEYCTFPLDMDPEILPEGTPVPVNPVQVIRQYFSFNHVYIYIIAKKLDLSVKLKKLFLRHNNHILALITKITS